jgi:SNF2 family DNA or RNA helicase
MPFQIEGIRFAEQSNVRCLIADEQGLGKTVQGCGLIRLHKDELTPAVIVTKTTIKKQWMWELIRWIGSRKVQVISSSKELPVYGFDFYITTYDLLGHLDESLSSASIDIQTLIIDECQAIKNHLSQRAKNVQKFGQKVPHIIGMSGTPIKNNAGEYFTILNLLQPTRFPEYSRFLRDYCDSYESAWGYKVGGLSSIESFQEVTKDFIIRRTQSEVLPDLFALKQPRKFQHVELDKKFNKAYQQGINELDDLMYSDDDGQDTNAAMIAIMTKLRQITGLSKTVECVDYVTEHLLSTGRKIIVFAHHHAVVDLLENNINKWLKDGDYNPAVIIRAGDNGTDKVKLFSDSNSPVCIASTLASGEGLDGLQRICSDMILLERQWNPANEEQVEGRLARIGQERPVNFVYMIASETIDEYFTELVETKRSYVASALDGQIVNWNESSMLKELAIILTTKGKKKWTL